MKVLKYDETVKSIRETARDNVDILLINDASTDSFDYEEIGRVYKVKYMVNKKRLGPCFFSRFRYRNDRDRLFFDCRWTYAIL